MKVLLIQEPLESKSKLGTRTCVKGEISAVNFIQEVPLNQKGSAYSGDGEDISVSELVVG